MRFAQLNDSPDRGGGEFGSMASKIAMPRTNSEIRMTWTEKGPYGAAAPRNHENFRQRMQGSPEVHATPAG